MAHVNAPSAFHAAGQAAGVHGALIHDLPPVGWGSFRRRGPEVVAAAAAAAAVGVRLFDSVTSYRDEEALHEAFALSGLSRSQV